MGTLVFFCLSCKVHSQRDRFWRRALKWEETPFRRFCRMRMLDCTNTQNEQSSMISWSSLAQVRRSVCAGPVRPGRAEAPCAEQSALQAAHGRDAGAAEPRAGLLQLSVRPWMVWLGLLDAYKRCDPDTRRLCGCWSRRFVLA